MSRRFAPNLGSDRSTKLVSRGPKYEPKNHIPRRTNKQWKDLSRFGTVRPFSKWKKSNKFFFLKPWPISSEYLQILVELLGTKQKNVDSYNNKMQLSFLLLIITPVSKFWWWKFCFLIYFSSETVEDLAK